MKRPPQELQNAQFKLDHYIIRYHGSTNPDNIQKVEQARTELRSLEAKYPRFARSRVPQMKRG